MYIKENKNKYFRIPKLDGIEMLYAQNHKTNFPFHTHDSFNISLVLENTFQLKTIEKTHIAPKGTIVITNPFELHATPCNPSIGTTFYTFYVPLSLFNAFNPSNGLYFKKKIINDSKLFEQFYNLSLLDPNQLCVFEKKLFKVLKTLIEKHSTNKSIGNKENQLLADYVDNMNVFQNFSLENTASKFGLNKFKFLRIFKEEYGLTPTNYILMRRIEKSKQYLSENRDIFGIAMDCGFYDTSHFYRNFIKFTGIAPSEYQKAFM